MTGIESRFSQDDKVVIGRLAAGDDSARGDADLCYAWHLRHHGVAHQDPYFEFLSELNSPVPCHVQKRAAREAILRDPASNPGRSAPADGGKRVGR